MTHRTKGSRKRKAEDEHDDDSTNKKVRKRTNEVFRFGMRTVAISVGSGANQKTFDAHEDLLTSHSDYFRAAVNGSWKEATLRNVGLDDEDPEAFQVFYKFIYSGSVFSAKEGDHKKKKAASSSENDDEWKRLASCWILGERLLSTTFKDAVVDAIIAKHHVKRQYPIGMDIEIYPNSHARSRARKLLVDLAVWKWDDQTLEQQLKEDTSRFEFLYDVAAALGKIRRTGCQGASPLDGTTCIYHEHEADGKPCYKTMFR